MPLNQDNTLPFLQRELQVIAAFGGPVLLIGFHSLRITLGWMAAGQWLLQAALFWFYTCLSVKRRLPLNRATENSPLYSGLGWGNRLTILRGGLIALTGGFLFMVPTVDGNLWAPALLYTLAAILDRFDGFVARRTGQVTILGNELDITFDALGLLIAPLLAIVWGKLHASYLLLSVAYYVYQWGLQRRRNLGLPIHPTPPNPLRRTLAGFQMGLIAVALWPVLDPALTKAAGAAFMLPVLFGFTIDWLVVCGTVQPQAVNGLAVVSSRYFQPGLRLLLVALLFLLAPELKLFGHSQLTLDLVIVLISTCFILLGFAGRFGALLLILCLSWQDANSLLNILGAALIVTLSWILLLGTGRFSLWPWGDEWVIRYDGA